MIRTDELAMPCEVAKNAAMIALGCPLHVRKVPLPTIIYKVRAPENRLDCIAR